MFDLAPAPDPGSLQQSEAFERALAGIGSSAERLENGALVLKRNFGPLTLRMLARPQAGCTTFMRQLLKEIPGHGPVLFLRIIRSIWRASVPCRLSARSPWRNWI